ncbi:hypothetical protein DL96DRAFT_1560046 [Flagelloscypha sp. PMI_526]|nr:hypothetical protein DL96DRAFT_1560046 [Flagelloscypha sp. PMI_526]
MGETTSLSSQIAGKRMGGEIWCSIRILLLVSPCTVILRLVLFQIHPTVHWNFLLSDSDAPENSDDEHFMNSNSPNIVDKAISIRSGTCVPRRHLSTPRHHQYSFIVKPEPVEDKGA